MPSSRSYSIVEPHPSITSNAYMLTGRGGAGNLTRAPTSVTRGADAAGPASHFSSFSTSATSKSSTSRSTSTSTPFMTGRGGAGNIHHPPSERAIFSFDEELERQLSQERKAAPVYHVGRGGAGNVYGRRRTAGVEPFVPVRRTRTSEETEAETDGNSEKSDSSARSAESGADVATRAMKKGWKKITGAY